jgi:hypothetical protein
MAVAAPVVQFRKEFIGTFEQTVSMLRATTTREAVIKGNQAVFLVAGSPGDTAVTRGANGSIPYNQAQNTQNTAILKEKHAPYEMTGFNIFASQGDQIQIMRRSSMAVINRDIDLEIISQLDTATQTCGAPATASLALISLAKGILGIGEVDVSDEDNLFAAITPAYLAYLEQTTEYASGDYVNIKPFAGITRKTWRWHGVNWIVSTRLTGMGTGNEFCYMFHRDAIGHAVSIGEESIMLGYDEKQDTSWSRATMYHGAKLLQNGGIVRMRHDGSAIVPT